MAIFSVVDAHIDPVGSVHAVIQSLDSLSDDSMEAEAEGLSSYLQIVLCAESMPREAIQRFLVALDRRAIDPASCHVRLPLCVQALGELLRDALSTLSMKRERSPDPGTASSLHNGTNSGEIVRTMLCYSVGACISLSQSLGIAGLIRALDTYLSPGPTFDLIIQRCLFSRLFTPNTETLLMGVDTLCSRGRHATLSASVAVGNASAAKDITMHLVLRRPRDFLHAFAAGLEMEGCQASTLSEPFTLESIAQLLLKRFPCDASSMSSLWIDSFVSYVVESNDDPAFTSAFSSCFLTWISQSSSAFLTNSTTQGPWVLTLLDRLVNVMTACTRAPKRFISGLCVCFTMLTNTEVIKFACERVDRPQSASLGAEINFIAAILMKLAKAIRMFMQASPALESHQLLFVDTVVPYTQALILSDRDAAVKQLSTLTDPPATINVSGGFAASLASRGDLLLQIATSHVILQGVANATQSQELAVASNDNNLATDGQSNADHITIASTSRIAHTLLPGLLAEIFGQEPVSGDLLSNLHKSIPKSLEEAISLLQYPSGQPQSRYYHMLSLASLPPLLRNTSQIIIISKAQELLDSVLWLDDIATLQTIKGKSAWHALKARSISGAIEKAPYVVGTTLIESSLQKHKATVGGFMTGLRALTEVSCRLTARQALCLISTLNQRSQTFFRKIELTEPVFFTLTSLVSTISKSSDRQALRCVPLCCNNYVDQIVRRSMLCTIEPASNAITDGEKIFISALIHACAQTTGALKILLSVFSKQTEDTAAIALPSPFILTSLNSLEQIFKPFSSVTRSFELSEEECGASLGSIIHNTNEKLAQYQTDYVQSLRGFEVIDRLTQMMSGKSSIDTECRVLLRRAAGNILDFFGIKEQSELLFKKANYPQS